MNYNKKYKAAIIIVIHNKLCSDSDTISSFSEHLPYLVLVLDNSTEKTVCSQNEQYCLKHGYDYHSFGANLGLSPAYNYGIAHIMDQTDKVILFDDDTTLPDTFFQFAEKAIANYPDSAVMVPHVYAGRKLISPCRRFGPLFLRFRPHVFERELQANASAINSGMIIKLGIINLPFENELLYDEKLFLDCIDHDFILNRVRGQGLKMSAFPAILQQRFFDQDNKNASDLRPGVRRFRIFVRDYLYYCQKNKLGFSIPRLYILFRALKLSISARSLAYITCLRSSSYMDRF